jgi:5-methylcytosine-specific restriction protein B
MADPVLGKSEPLRFRCQGTLFGLTLAEANHLMALLSERNPELPTIAEGADEGEVGRLTRVTFHPSYAYEDFVEGFRPTIQEEGSSLSLHLEDGVFKRVCRAALADPQRPYLLLVDEINRGNVAKVLGELLTLLEMDKRGVTVTLPQSKETFFVPPNVYLLGTMNTADRSIKLLDAALRRRFSFIELMPDLALLHGAKIGDLALDDFLQELNRRIAKAEGREKQIGHSYLLEGSQAVTEPEQFASRFREEILPLLQEYCYDDFAELRKFIGPELVNIDDEVLNEEKLADPEQLITALATEFGTNGDDEA